MPIRVAGTDPGTSSLDVLVLEDGAVADQARFRPEDVQADADAPVRWLQERGPFALVAGPSGYGLPLVRGPDCTEAQRRLMTLVRPDDDRPAGVLGFSRLVEAFCASELPVVFLPGVIHLDTVPAHRKHNRIDLGTPDKLCVAALALALWPRRSLCVVELGSAFTACVVLAGGQIIDGVGGTAGAVGWRAAGAWDGELAYLLSPLRKEDLFSGGAESSPELFVESLTRTVAGMLAVHHALDAIVLSGRLLDSEPEVGALAERALSRLSAVGRLGSLPGARVKHAAQGAAVLADGLAGGRWQSVVEGLRLRHARGSVLDWVTHPRRGALDTLFPHP
jgi:predicted butyrate kinase (DUF1464 family)